LGRNKKGKTKKNNSSKRFKINIVLEKKYIDREKSWLAFNARVLQEAADESVPLLDRLRFLGIFSNR
jgi:polyphosphate kinase